MSNPEQLIEQLTAIVGPRGINKEPSDLGPYLVDWRRRIRGAALCAVHPGSTGEVAQVVAACAAARMPMVPQGGNTGLCGGATPDAGGHSVIISLRRMNRIRALDAQNGTVTVESGCILGDVQRAAREADRLFPLSLAAEGSCQIGGNLSTNAGGIQVLRYGNARELCLGLEVVLPDGQVWDGLRGLRKDNTGYDLKQLFIGAEGTLGVITAAVLKLFPLPKAHATAWIGLRTPQSAVDLLSAAQAAFGARLSAFELIADFPLALVLQHMPSSTRPLPEPHAWNVLMALSDCDDEPGLQEHMVKFLSRHLESGAISDAVIAQTIEHAQRLWFLRESISEAQAREGYRIAHDVSVPVSRIPEFLSRGAELLPQLVPGVRPVAFGHLGDGNLHYNVMQPAPWPGVQFSQETARINRAVHDLVHEFQGSISAEHGLGQIKRGEILRYKSPLEIELMRSIKTTLDPHNLMNPGKVV